MIYRPFRCLLVALFSFTSLCTLSANPSDGWLRIPLGTAAEEPTNQAILFHQHPFVALPVVTESVAAAAMVSPDPNQLRIQDLRGVECYPQPDNLEVCGAADTTCVLLFTKSEERLPEIELTLRFGEGLEISQFPSGDYALIDYSDDAVFPPPLTDIDLISDQNPEAPSFLISGVTRDSGAVYVCFGVRAECGADFEAAPPTIEFNWRYTTESGVACEGNYALPGDFGGDVRVPRVQFTAPLPGNTNLNSPNSLACQSINVTQTTPMASAGGYIFTAAEYGFDEGIMIVELRRNATVIPTADYTIAANGMLTYNYDGSTDPLAFNEVDEIEVCYQYTSCFENQDFFPVYTVVSACDGVLCTGPVNQNNTGRLVSNFPGGVALNASYEAVEVNTNNEGLPSVCGPEPYVFDIVYTSNVNTVVRGDIYNLRSDLRACLSTALGLAKVEVVDNASMTVLGVLDDNVSIVRTTQELNNQGNPTLNRAGTVRVDLARNNNVTTSALQDIDGDGAFNDIPAGQVLRLRYTFDVICGAEDAGDVSAPQEAGATTCQFTQIGLSYRRNCDSDPEGRNLPLTQTPTFNNTSVSEFDNPTAFNLGGPRQGYNFGNYGVVASTGVPYPVATEDFVFTYTLGNDPLTSCPGGNGTSTLTLFTAGDPRITNDIMIGNINIDNTGDGNADITGATAVRTIPVDGQVQFEIDMGGATPGTEYTIDFQLSVDSNFCSPPQLQFLTGIITTECSDPCACEPVQTAITSPMRFNPEDDDCECYLNAYVEAKRLSTGFTDETRTVRVDPDNVPEADQVRVMPGDTVELKASYVVRDNPSGAIDDELNGEVRDLRLNLDVRSATNRTWIDADQTPNLLDGQLTRLQAVTLFRDGQGPVNVGASFSGGQAAPSSETNVFLPYITGTTTADGFPQEGEVFNPGFPNGGYTFAQGTHGNDSQDGRRIGLWMRDFRDGSANGVAPFYDALDGEWQAGDSLEVVWTVVIAENPGQDETQTEVNLQFRPYVRIENYIGDPAENITVATAFNGCEFNTEILEWFNPEVTVTPTIEFDDCDTEIAITFDLTEPPATWYQNEYRPIHGIEQFSAQIPASYYYSGGATYENLAGMASVEPDSSAMVDTASVAGTPSFLPVISSLTGNLIFRDAELLDGVRGNGTDNFDFGDNDVTTVGGTFPLLGVGGSRTDDLTFRIPLDRLCGDEPSTTLTVDYDWANKHLPDYEAYPYEVGSVQNQENPDGTPGGVFYWAGKVEDNQGDNVTPVPGPGGSFYFPFPRLPIAPGDRINPHRSTANAPVQYTLIGPAPGEAFATTGIAPAGPLADMDGDETKTITVSPPAGTALSGVIAVTVSTGGVLNGVTEAGGGAAITFSQSAINDSLTVYSIPIPTGLAADAMFSFDLNTDLIICEAVEICVTPLLGCDEDPDAVAQAVAAFGRMCGGQACYNYGAGSAMVRTTITDPSTVGLCEQQTFEVQYFNEGTGDLSNFDPVLYIPEGITAMNFQYSTTGGATGTLSDPTYDDMDSLSNLVFGEGFTFSATDIMTAVAANGTPLFNPGQVLTITFDGQTGCDFTSGLPLVSIPRARNGCGEDVINGLAFSRNVDVDLPPGSTPNFSFTAGDGPLTLSCSEDGDRIIITAVNVGKAGSAAAEICVRLPEGISLDLAGANALSPDGFTVDPASIETSEINEGGAVQQCFMAPELPQGGFVCLEVPFIVGDIPCGETFIGATIVSTVSVACANPLAGDTNPCDIRVSNVENLYFPVEIVPAVSAQEATLAAACTGTPGVFDVEFEFDFVAESDDVMTDVVLSLFSDVNANGEFDEDVDVQIGVDQTVSVDLLKDEAETFNGTFPGVNQDEICPLLLRITGGDCTCSEAILPFPDVLPDFLADLGDAITLCPGEPFTFDGICADLDYAFDPPAAGTITIDDVTKEATVTINPGFGVETPVDLNITGAFGTCATEKTIKVSAPTTLGFGPYEYAVCNVGRQEVDLNIPQAQQEDISVSITPTNNILNPMSFEPIIEDLPADQVFDVEFSFNDGECTSMTTLTVTVDEAPTATITDFTACQTGFDLRNRLVVTPANLTGSFQTDGDGEFLPDNEISDENGNPLPVRYIPGPDEIEQGFVSLRFNSDDPDGPCGPVAERLTVTILLVDCGNFFWDGSNDD